MHPADREDGGGDDRFWSAFAATSYVERLQAWRYRWTAPWRGVAASRMGWLGGRTSAPPTVSCRALLLALLIHLRFSDEKNLAVASGERDVANSSRGVHPRLDGRTTSTLAPYACHAHTLPCTICYPLRRRKTDLALLLGAFQAPPCSKGWPPCDTWTWATSVIESRTFVPSSSVGEGGGDGL